jgi:hypothetical protein
VAVPLPATELFTRHAQHALVAHAFAHTPAAFEGSIRTDNAVGLMLNIILIATGAILRWAITATGSVFNIQLIGGVLLIIGTVGVLLSLIFWSTWGGANPFFA